MAWKEWVRGVRRRIVAGDKVRDVRAGGSKSCGSLGFVLSAMGGHWWARPPKRLYRQKGSSCWWPLEVCSITGTGHILPSHFPTCLITSIPVLAAPCLPGAVSMALLLPWPRAPYLMSLEAVRLAGREAWADGSNLIAGSRFQRNELMKGWLSHSWSRETLWRKMC